MEENATPTGRYYNDPVNISELLVEAQKVVIFEYYVPRNPVASRPSRPFRDCYGKNLPAKAASPKIFLFFCTFLSVVGHALEVNQDHWLIPDHPGVMSRWNR